MEFLKRLFRRGAAAPDAGRERATVNLVVLSCTRVELSVDLLRTQLDGIFPGHFLPPRRHGNFVIDGPVAGAEFFVQCAVPGAAGTFLLHTVAGPYAEVSPFAARIEDEALRRLCEAQTCWLSVDLVSRHTSDDDAYRFIGRVLARLAPADAAALVHPSRLVTHRFDDELRRRLANGERI
jgi:hypothetical protein